MRLSGIWSPQVFRPRLFQEVIAALSPLVLALINSSLSLGVVPKSFKHATFQHSTVLSNFRPISELYLPRILEKVVYNQLKAVLDENNILELFQSGFKPIHSTESVLLRVFNPTDA